MNKAVFFPYPRLRSVDWSELTVAVEGTVHSFDRLPDLWDSNSEATFKIAASIDWEAFEAIDADLASTRLVIEVTSRDTAYSLVQEASLVRKADVLEATTEIQVTGSSVSESLDISTSIIAPVNDIQWLRRRVIATGPNARVPLNSDMVGFPTSAFSFNEEQLPAAPWRLVLSAEDLEAPFAHSVRLELNEDFQVVRELIEGKASASVRAELVSTITRVLIGTIAGIKLASNDPRSTDEIVEAAPDSITAAASRASNQYLGTSLDASVGLYNRQPELFDYKLKTGSDHFRIK